LSLFGLIKCDDKVFTGDKLLVDVSGSFLAPGLVFATISHEISFDAGVTWIDISSTKKINWIFSTSGTKLITLRLNSTVPSTATFTKSVTCLNLTTQGLFSNDSDLYGYETEIDQYLPKKWSSWNLVHLKAQEWIVDWLDEKRLFKEDGTKYQAADILDVEQVKQLSCAKVLELIYESNINTVGDVFTVKRDKYKEMVQEKASKSQIALDFNGNATQEVDEKTDLLGITVRRA
jgi:uncharacterized protein YktA (UPF0223 family)